MRRHRRTSFHTEEISLKLEPSVSTLSEKACLEATFSSKHMYIPGKGHASITNHSACIKCNRRSYRLDGEKEAISLSYYNGWQLDLSREEKETMDDDE